MARAAIDGAALVTGGAKRLGAALVRALAADGFDVAIHCHQSTDAAEALADELRARGQRAVVLAADLCDAAARDGLIPRAQEALGPLGLLVNNASVFEYDRIDSMTRTGWDQHLRANLEAPLFLAQAFAAQVKGGARDATGQPVARAAILNMLDQRVKKLSPEFFSYGISKFGLWGATQMLAQGLAPDIRVNGIGPGPSLQGVRQSDAHFAAQKAGVLLQRDAGPDEIVAAMRFILASEGFTGQILCLDAGQHLGWRTPDVVGKV